MRHGEPGFGDALRIVEKQVEVQRARRVREGTLAAEALFNFKQGTEQVPRRERGG